LIGPSRAVPDGFWVRLGFAAALQQRMPRRSAVRPPTVRSERLGCVDFGAPRGARRPGSERL